MSSYENNAGPLLGPEVYPGGREAYNLAREKARSSANIYGEAVLGTQVADKREVRRRPEQAEAMERASIARETRQAEQQRLLDARRAANAALETATHDAANAAQIAELEAAPGITDVGLGEAPGVEGVDGFRADPENLPQGDTSGDGYLSETEVADALGRQPELYERLLELELGRGQGPRKGVGAILADFERTKRPGGPRKQVIGKLNRGVD